MTSQNEIPSLKQLARGPVKQIVEVADNLSLSEILIVGARPLQVSERKETEIRELNRIALQKIRELESRVDDIFYDIRGGVYESFQCQTERISNYLEKYSFIIETLKLPDGLIEKCHPKVIEDIRKYRKNIPLSPKNNRLKKVREFRNLGSEPLNLLFHYDFTKEGNPYLICVKKSKTPRRIAHKITYLMLNRYRARGTKKGTKLKNYIKLEDGVNQDNAGIQYVDLDGKQLVDVKQHIFQSDNIEVVPNKEGIPFEEHNLDGYQAFHVLVNWNPLSPQTENITNLFYDPHMDPVEIQLMDLRNFMNSNFGPRGCWRRAEAQKLGILTGRMSYGVLEKEGLTNDEKYWRKEIEKRIINILTYRKER